jgi:hypothetical protein
MWFLVIFGVSILTGLVMGPVLSRAAAEQTADPRRTAPPRSAGNRITPPSPATSAGTSRAPAARTASSNRLLDHARQN